MRVFTLKKPPTEYSSNVYYILGDWNTIPDKNTLIDVGPNDYILAELTTFNSGVGKKKLENIILTHEHFDHAAALKYLIPLYNPKVYGFSQNLPNVEPFVDNMKVQIGDRTAVLIHTPGHSNDSIGIYVEEEGVLFSGDTMLSINSYGDTYTLDFLHTIQKIFDLDLKIIYPGHGDPIKDNIKEMLTTTLKIVEDSKIIV